MAIFYVVVDTCTYIAIIEIKYRKYLVENFHANANSSLSSQLTATRNGDHMYEHCLENATSKFFV